jgi:CheY-like chemotaxis protein
MRLLIVDDDSDLVELLARRIVRISPLIEVVTAESVADAREAIAAKPPDLCIIDLALPSARSAHDESVDKGEQLVREIAALLPGTFIILYSGFSEDRITDPLYEQLNARRPNILGELEAAMFLNRPKKHPLRAVDDVEKIFARRKVLLETVQFEDYEVEADLEQADTQILRAFGKSRGASTIRLKELSGGKSGARVFAVTYFDADAKLMLRTVAKLDHWSRVSNEEQNFEAYVAGMLEIGSYAPLLNRETFLCCQTAGMFYQEIEPLLEDLSCQWGALGADATGLIDKLRTIQHRWTDIARVENYNIGELRRLVLSDDALNGLGALPFDVSRIERIPMRVRMCIQHGDLHAGNVLLTSDVKPYLLDFASIRRLPASFDPLTLELAYVFNNPSRSRTAWPDESTIRNWHRPEVYFERCPAKAMLSAARRWAIEASSGLPPTAIYASTFCYALRQLQYPDTDKTLALALAETTAGVLERA